MVTLDPLIAVRGVHFAATALASGTAFFMVLVGGPAVTALPALRRRLNATVWIALAVVVVSGLAWLAVIAANILDAPLTEICLHGGAWPVATGTRFGQVTCLRLGVAGLLAVLMRWPVARLLQLLTAATLIGLLGLVGHAGATPGTAGTIHLTSDLVHLVAAAAWLGGLPALTMTLSATTRGGRDGLAGNIAVEVTGRFSVLGIVCVAALVLSGLVNSIELLSSPGDLIATAYGRLLTFKIGLFGAMVALAAVNRLRLTPRLPALDTVRALQRNIVVETGLGLCVIFLVGALGTLPPGAHVHTNSAEIPPDAAFVHIHTEVVMADVTIDPGRTGKTQATIHLSREDSSDFAAKDVRLSLEPRDGGAPTIMRDAVPAADGTWHVSGVDIPRAGVWIVRVIVDTGAGAPTVLDAPIAITQCSNEC